jgi:hypothetical protein
MKCKHCDGDGVIVDVEYGHAGKYGCKYCNGTGVVEPLTKEEWIKSANTEQLAEFLHDVQFSCNTCTPTSFRLYKSKVMKCPLQVSCAKENGVMEWLKQPHTAK